MNKKIVLGLIALILLVSFVYALGTVSFIGASNGEIIINETLPIPFHFIGSFFP